MMTVVRAYSRVRSQSTEGHVLYGNNPEGGKFFERWYPSREKAEAFATKRGWEFQNMKRVNGIEVAA